MSFEFDEQRLATPPIKSDQLAVITFWGIYRWPHKIYNRYAQLEGLEQTADETRTMTRALGNISQATELGISIDGGLGYLTGPDVNSRVADRGEAPVVFGETRFVPEPKYKHPLLVPKTKSDDPPSYYSPINDSLYESFERMLIEAGYRGENLVAAVRLMMESEGRPVAPAIHRSTSNDFTEAVHRVAGGNEPEGPTAIASTAGDLTTFADAIVGQYIGEFPSTNDGRPNNPKLRNTSPPLRPNDLTSAQKEMLLEIEWAQRAFMQSYVIAVIDNPLTFKNITALVIARLPSGQLTSLRREDFWTTLCKIEKLTLGVIPDWREVSKLPEGWVHEQRLQPSLAVTSVYQVLQEQVSRRENIKRLHFEWLCGGEYAPGAHARNQNILAAPLVPRSMDMVCTTPGQKVQVLTLPHVECLSLKNCWTSPHILQQFLALGGNSLQSLEFDSVSLSAPIPLRANPGPANVANHGVAAMNQMMNAVAVHQATLQWQQHVQAQAPPLAAQNQPPPVPPQPPQQPVQVNTDPVPIGLEWLRVRNGCWSELISEFTPGKSLADARYERGVGPKPPLRLPTKLKKMEFRSCGYVRMDLDFEQSMLDAPDAPGLPLAGKRGTGYDTIMMFNQDNSLATIVNHISAMESATLQNIWGMETSWNISRGELVLDAKQDLVLNAGRGRFDGIIEAPKEDRLLTPTNTGNIRTLPRDSRRLK
jgi:hypothetical protein